MFYEPRHNYDNFSTSFFLRAAGPRPHGPQQTLQNRELTSLFNNMAAYKSSPLPPRPQIEIAKNGSAMSSNSFSSSDSAGDESVFMTMRELYGGDTPRLDDLAEDIQPKIEKIQRVGYANMKWYVENLLAKQCGISQCSNMAVWAVGWSWNEC